MNKDAGEKALAKLAIKYQVLSEETAFVGIVKNKNKSDQEVERIVMPTISPEDYEEPQYFARGLAFNSARPKMASAMGGMRSMLSSGSRGGRGGA